MYIGHRTEILKADVSSVSPSSERFALTKGELGFLKGLTLETSAFRISVRWPIYIINSIEKFTYLKSCVTSNAESAIAGLPLTADHYKIAIDILKDRFGKPQLLISNYMDALLKLPSVNSVHETKKLRELFDKIEINIRGLNALGVESQSFGNLLVPVVMEKIPSEFGCKPEVWQ